MVRATLIAVIAAASSITSSGQLTTTPPVANGMSFQVPSVGASAAQILTVSSAIGATTLIISVPANQTWLSVNSFSGGNVFILNIPTNTPAAIPIAVAVTSAGLNSGQTYSANIGIAIVGQPSTTILFPVTLTVGAASILSANPATLAFTAVQGAFSGSPASAGVAILSSGAQLNYTITGSTTTGVFWLLLSSTAGTTGSSAPFQVRVNPSQLLPGNYFGTVMVQSTTTSDSVTIPVTLYVTAGPTIPGTPAPSTLMLLLVGVVCSWIWKRSWAGRSRPITQTRSQSGTKTEDETI